MIKDGFREFRITKICVQSVRELERKLQQKLKHPLQISRATWKESETTEVILQTTDGGYIIIEASTDGCQINKREQVVGMTQFGGTTLKQISVFILPVCPHGFNGLALSLDFCAEKLHLAWAASVPTCQLSVLPEDVILLMAKFLCPENVTFYFSRGCPTPFIIKMKLKRKLDDRRK
eukprot:TRINITY_DN10315_c0_g3_i1.p1 TRINITY_DN10315_c0_g3~~TRINITY_DN10315_c0_g3_i1.p1  ORF type:complete len:177 (+),score=31.80 TRINITY_DN10315_c0_g3_i1:102-632(+)